MPLTPEGWTLLTTWEGCELSAYPDPASGGAPWTIGYGHTGPDVCPGLTISQAQAEAWLKQDAAEAAGAVDRLLSGVELTAHQRDALISFSFNVGAGALERSTLRMRLLAGESPAVVIAEELPRWCKGPNGPVEGLKRRRAAEVAHAAIEAQSLHMASTGASQARPMQGASQPIQLLDAVHHHRDLPHQRQAWQMLQLSLTAEQLNAFATAFRASGKAATPTRPPAAAEASTGLLQLPVPYLSQNDSATGQGSRMCFASSCAMAATFLKPGCLDGAAQHDDHYLKLVQRYGDTTNASAQVEALRSLGLRARFRTDGCIDHLIEQLQRGIPCPVGWLHKGPVSAPTGGGHWSLVIGWDAVHRKFLMHDPNGEADLVNGGYVTTAIGSGKAQRYSERNWGRRWVVEGAGSGWWIDLQQDTGTTRDT